MQMKSSSLDQVVLSDALKKLRFPIEVDSKPFWIEVAIVKADIPMLLGNNLFKPLGAVIIIFPTGNGTLILDNVEIPF